MFAPLPGDVSRTSATATSTRWPPPSSTADRRVFLETIMGERVVVPPAGYLTAARDITAQARGSALLVLTRCKPGWAAPERSSPTSTTASLLDVVTLAMGLGGGAADRCPPGRRAGRRNY